MYVCRTQRFIYVLWCNWFIPCATMDECLRGHRIVVQFFLYGTIRARISWTVIFPLLTPSGRLHMRYTHSTHYDNRWDGLLDVCVLRFTALRALTYVCTWVCVCVCGMVNTLLLNNKHNKTSRRQVKDSIHSLTVTIMWEWTAGSRLGFWHIQFYVPHMYGYTYRIRITFIHPEWTRRIQHFSFHLFARKYFERRKNFSIRNFLESLKHGNFFNSHYFRYQKYSLCCVNNVDCMEFH